MKPARRRDLAGARYASSTTDQLDGLACVRCGRPLDQPDSPPSFPVDGGSRGQVFACHPSCIEAEPAARRPRWSPRLP